MWGGMVNQHYENGEWKTDPDGSSGADIDKLVYCKKWYKSTTATEIMPEKERITFCNAGNKKCDYASTKFVYECVQGKEETPKVETVKPCNYFGCDPCQACVKLGHTWCKADDFFGGSSSCVADSTSGFFGDCSDIEFGSANLKSDLDCTFNTENGEVVLGVIIFAGLFVIWLGYWLIKHKDDRRRQMNTTPVSRVPQVQMIPGAMPMQPQVYQPQMQPQVYQPQMQPQVYQPQMQQPQMYQPQMAQGSVLGFAPQQQTQPMVVVGGQQSSQGAPIAQAVPVMPIPGDKNSLATRY